MFPSAAAQHAAAVEAAYAALRIVYAEWGRVPPSLDVLNEERRRDPLASIFGIIDRHHSRLATGPRP